MFPPTLKQKQKSKVFRHGFRLLVLVLLIQQLGHLICGMFIHCVTSHVTKPLVE